MNIRGVVRDNRNHEGIGGVAVSNGESVVRTEANGSYRIPFRPGTHRFIWLTVPDNHRTKGPFYRSKPGIDDRVDFLLVNTERTPSGRMRMVQLADIHLGKRIVGAQELRADLERVAVDTPDIAVISGDLTEMGFQEELQVCHEALEGSGLEYFPMFGGHDGRQERNECQSGTTCTLTYEQIFGPAYYSFDRGGRHFVLFPNEDRYFSESDVERKLSWLRADLRCQPADRKSVLFVHATPQQGFIEEVGAMGVEMLLFGHRHANKWYQAYGVQVGCCPPLCFGGTDYSPRGYRVVDFDREEVETHLVAILSHRERLKDDAPTIGTEGVESVAAASASVSSGGRTNYWRAGIDLAATWLEPRWEHQLLGDLPRGAMVRYEDSLLVGIDGHYGGESGLRCIDLTSGATRWHVYTDDNIQASPEVDAAGTCTVITPAGRLYCIDAMDGAIRWTADLPGFPERWIYCSPVTGHQGKSGADVIYAGSNAGWGAFDGGTGANLWYHSFVGNAPRIIDKPSRARAMISGDLLIALIPKRGLVALDRKVGDMVWERPLAVQHYWATPVVTEDLIITGGDPGMLTLIQAGTGELVNEWPLDGDYPVGLEVVEGSCYVGFSDGRIAALHLADGQLRWIYETGKALVDVVPTGRGGPAGLSSPLSWRGSLLVPGCDGFLHVIDRDTGSIEQLIDFGVPLCATPCVAEDSLCIATLTGRIVCFAP